MNKKIKLNRKRLTFLILLLIILVSLFFYFQNFKFYGNTLIYSYLGISAGILGLSASALSFVKFVTRKKDKYIFVGLGLVGAAVLDFYYMFFRAAFLPEGLFIWNNSSIFLSLLLLISAAVWFIEMRYFGKDKILKWYMVLGLMLVSVGAVFLFVFFRFSKELIISISFVFYFLTLIGYLVKRHWHYKYFEYLFIASLMTALFSSLFFYNSQVIFDNMFMVGEMMRLSTYLLMFSGLVLSSYNAFNLVEKYSKQVEARLGASIEVLPLGYLLLDTAGNLVVKNGRVIEILGKQTKDFEKLDKALSLIEHASSVKRKMRTEVADIEFNKKYLKAFYTPVVANGEAAGTVVLVQDVTEQKLLDKSKDEFIALASHELRTPITTVKGNSEIILKLISKAELTQDELDEMVNDIYASSLKLLAIVEQFLQVSSLEQERIKINKEKFNLIEMVKENIDVYSKIAKEKKLYLKLETDIDKLEVETDKKRLTEVINNLLDNAVKFTDSGGVVVRISKERNKVHVEIQDTGAGIKAKNRKLLFKKFTQVGEDFYKHDSTQGVGLGLYISRMLMDLLDGKIFLKSSEKDKGATFVIEIPY